ncbi:DUF998 domain-containing protein [Microbacterium caowuchunii]|nr:DUF998 domain-containing protein [Microbacterium caowuchunii]
MRLAVPFFSGVSSAVIAFGQTPPERTRVRAWTARLLGASAMHLAVLVLLILVVGIGISIATTTDPQWWRLHFSQLGTFKNGSAAFFNGALIVGGSAVVIFGRAAARELRSLGRNRVRRGTARTARICFSTIGVNLALVGCIPLNSNGFVHDRVAAGMVLGFATLLLVSPVMMHRMPRRLLLATVAIFVVLFAGAWVFVTGDINLALFEVIAFGSMFAWSGVFLSALTVSAQRDAALTPSAAPAVVAAAPAVVSAAPVAAPASIPSAARAIAAPTAAAAVGIAPSAPAEQDAPRPVAATARRSAVPAAWAEVRPVRHLAPRRPRAHRRVTRRDVPVRPRRGCTASAGRATSERSRTAIRR